MYVRDYPLFTDSYFLNEFTPQEGSAYIFGTSVEERSAHSEEWEAKANNVDFVRIVKQEASQFTAEFQGTNYNIPLRSGKKLSQLISAISSEKVYLDITGLAHHIWAPLLKSAIQAKKQVLAVYVEPSKYRPSSTAPEEEKLTFELSTEIKEIYPLPGFITFKEVEEDRVCFVPLLGFEGVRLTHILDKVQPPGEKIVPIIGVPGFRAEYPFHTYHGNQPGLTETHAWKNVRFAKANCPFSLFYVLQGIEADYPNHLLKIATIGTKPHALGAVLYTIYKSPTPVELIYDHPVRKEDRTEGTARLLVYHVTALPF